MGRKLNPIEAVSPDFCDVSEETSSVLPSRRHLLQQQIAEQLGISSEEFSKVPQPASGAQKGRTPSGAFDIALRRECLELLEAYSQIKDPKQRRRCLQAVREAAYGADGAGPVAEA